VCDPQQGKCVPAGFVRVLRASPGVLCRYSQKWAPLGAPTSIPAAPASYVPLPPGDQNLVVLDAGPCPFPVSGLHQKRAQGLVLQAGAFHSFVDIAEGTALFADDVPVAAGPTRVRYVDLLAAFVDAPLDFSSSAAKTPPTRLQSGGLLALGAGPNGPGYVELSDDHRPSPTNPLVVTTDAPRFHFLGSPIPMPGARLTAYVGAGPDGPLVLLCPDGFVGAACQILARAGKDGGGNCDPRTNQPAPWTCLGCGQSVHDGTYTCEGSVSNVWSKIVQEPACACRPGVPVWNHCVMGDNTSCATLCTKLGRTCAAKCSVAGVCVGSDKASFDNETWQGQGTVCEGMSVDCAVGPKYCTNAFNGYCCCQ
jgi:hypothetical protein